MERIRSKARAINKVWLIDVDSIRPNPSQPRALFDSAELEGLAESIRQNGLLQPLTVRRKERYYELVSGERRLRAIKLAGLAQAPCIVIDATERQAAVLALLENIQRADLNYFEEAVALKNLMVEWGVSQQELGERLGRAQSTIANKLRLLRFDENLRRKMLVRGVNERQARALLRIENPALLETALRELTDRQLNVEQTERYIEGLLAEKRKPPRRNRPIVKDVRLFFNTINRAISVMNESGIQASSERIEKEDCIEYIVKIPI